MLGQNFGVNRRDFTADTHPPDFFFESIDAEDREADRAFYAKYLDLGGVPVAAAIPVGAISFASRISTPVEKVDGIWRTQGSMQPNIVLSWSEENPKNGRGWRFCYQPWDCIGMNGPVQSFWNRMGFYRGRSGKETVSDLAEYAIGCEEVDLPIWFLPAVFAILPLSWMYGLVRATSLGRRTAQGHCAICGYDLRATPERCPECFHVPEKVKSTT